MPTPQHLVALQSVSFPEDTDLLTGYMCISAGCDLAEYLYGHEERSLNAHI